MSIVKDGRKAIKQELRFSKNITANITVAAKWKTRLILR